jgi:hypothetical protein
MTRMRYDSDLPLYSRAKAKNPNKRGPVKAHDSTGPRVTPHSKPHHHYHHPDAGGTRKGKGLSFRDKNRHLLAEDRSNPFTKTILRKDLRHG